MRTKRMILLMMCMVVGLSFIFSSCNDDKVVYYTKGYKSWFTVKVEDDSYYFLHDKGKTFYPVNLKNYSPKKEVRAYAYYQVALEEDDKGYDYPIRIQYIDTILTKQIAPDLGEENKSKYGDDPVRIDRMWVGGDYLNIRFSTYWGGREAHFVNLVQEDTTDAYTLRFRHNAYDDPKWQWGYGWVAFNLSTLPVDEKENTLKISIEVNTYDGLKTKTFEYNPNRSVAEDPDDEEDDLEEDAKVLLK